MEIKEMNIEQLEERAIEIKALIDEANEETLETLSKEMTEIEERKASLLKEAEEQRKAMEEVAKGAGKPVENKESKMEVRNTKEYIDAFAKYIKTGKDAECRALLTENVSGGTVPVPELVESRVRKAWENDEIFSRISKTFVPGNLKVGFEISATDAVVHTEGANAPAEEVLTLGIVNMVPANIKKWITVSDEVLALGSEEFLTYIYDELTYKIIQKAADLVVAAIENAPAASSASAVGVAQISGTVSASTIIDAMAALGDGARNLVLIGSGATIATVQKAALQANFAYDPFQGMTVIKKDGVTGAIVGDLSGVQANLPEGEGITFKFDDLSLAEKDLVKIVGRLYAAIAVVGPKMFARILGE